MAGLMAKFDAMLGPLAPHRQAAASAPKPKKIAVFTATSHQGRSVCHSLIKDGLFLVTAITKFPHGEIAEEMRHMKIEVVKGDIADPASYEEYLQGKDGAFVNADFMEIFEHLAPNLSTAIELEITQSKAAVDACHRAGIKHIVYSAMDDLPEGVTVPPAVSKAEVVKYIRSLIVPATFIYPSHPYSDIIYHDFLRKNPRGEGYTLAIPAPDDCVLPGYAVEQFGDWVKVAFKKPEKWIGRSMHACGEQISVGEMAEALRKLSKRPVDSLHLTKDEFYSEENKADLGPVMFAQLKACYEGHMARRADESEKVAPHQWRFKQWAGQSQEIKELLKL